MGNIKTPSEELNSNNTKKLDLGKNGLSVNGRVFNILNPNFSNSKNKFEIDNLTKDKLFFLIDIINKILPNLNTTIQILETNKSYIDHKHKYKLFKNITKNIIDDLKPLVEILFYLKKAEKIDFLNNDNFKNLNTSFSTILKRLSLVLDKSNLKIINEVYDLFLEDLKIINELSKDGSDIINNLIINYNN